MRLLFCTILFGLLTPRWAHAEELIPGILAFDPPAFLSPAGPAGTNSENSIRLVRRYAATDNDPRTSQRLLIVSLREIGVAPDSGKAANNGQLGHQELVEAMQANVNATRNATNVSAVTKAEVGGQTAWLIAYQIPRPYWQKPDPELFPYEVYWVKVRTNQVAEIKLIADSTEHLQTLKTCLSRFKIIESNPSAVNEISGSAP